MNVQRDYETKSSLLTKEPNHRKCFGLLWRVADNFVTVEILYNKSCFWNHSVNCTNSRMNYFAGNRML